MRELKEDVELWIFGEREGRLNMRRAAIQYWLPSGISLVLDVCVADIWNLVCN